MAANWSLELHIAHRIAIRAVTKKDLRTQFQDLGLAPLGGENSAWWTKWENTFKEVLEAHPTSHGSYDLVDDMWTQIDPENYPYKDDKEREKARGRKAAKLQSRGSQSGYSKAHSTRTRAQTFLRSEQPPAKKVKVEDVLQNLGQSSATIGAPKATNVPHPASKNRPANSLNQPRPENDHDQKGGGVRIVPQTNVQNQTPQASSQQPDAPNKLVANGATEKAKQSLIVKLKLPSKISAQAKRRDPSSSPQAFHQHSKIAADLSATIQKNIEQLVVERMTALEEEIYKLKKEKEAVEGEAKASKQEYDHQVTDFRSDISMHLKPTKEKDDVIANLKKEIEASRAQIQKLEAENQALSEQKVAAYKDIERLTAAERTLKERICAAQRSLIGMSNAPAGADN